MLYLVETPGWRTRDILTMLSDEALLEMDHQETQLRIARLRADANGLESVQTFAIHSC